MQTAIAKYFSARVPRYTSYPTAPHFSAAVDAGSYRAWLEAIDPAAELSLYLHVPFCRQMCWYCGCNMRVVARYDPVADYTQTLIREIGLAAAALPARMRVRHIHWGGGTPTALSGDDMAARFMTPCASASTSWTAPKMRWNSIPAPSPLNPRKRLAAWAARGRASACRNSTKKSRPRSTAYSRSSMIEDSLNLLRENGVKAINFDLMYGLPHQTAASLKSTVEQTAALKPDRIALFGYAHVPWMATNQRMIPEDALPTPLMRFEQSKVAGDALVEQGYERIGLDHFALPGDGLAIAAREGRLRRNFQGYTDDNVPTLIAFGASSISALPQGYAQNIVETGAYTRAVMAGTLPIAKGIAFSGEDRLRAAIIERLMCDMAVDLDAVSAQFAPPRPSFADERAKLKDLAAEGLIEIEGSRILVKEEARPALRIVCAVFDTYLAESATPRHAAAV